MRNPLAVRWSVPTVLACLSVLAPGPAATAPDDIAR
jgi:hypothetical protein